MKNSQGFPPGAGWATLVVAVAVALVVSVAGIVPQFSSQVVAVQGGASGSATGTGPGSSAGTNGVAGTSAAPGTTAAGGPTGGGGGGTGSGSNAGTNPAGYVCAAGRNGGSTDIGVTATQIHVASTIVTTGVGKDFLGEAVDGMQAAINQANNAGGVCGRQITKIDGTPGIDTINDNWDGPTGQGYIQNWISSKNVFALVGEPDSEGLDAATQSGTIDRAGIPVVGTDGMLASQYKSQWIYPVAASTISNMHVAVKYAYDHGARSFGIVFDQKYKFGVEGAYAFDQEVHRETGQDVPGYSSSLSGCSQQFCGVTSEGSQQYTSQIAQFNGACAPCDFVMMLLEPAPMESWMRQEGGTWYKTLAGGEPLFDDNVGRGCPTCNGLQVWTGYRPAIRPFDGETAVSTYCNALKSIHQNDDCHNEFTEGAYLGTQLFIAALKQAGPNLTRASLRAALNAITFPSGLTVPLTYGNTLPHLANTSMTAFADNYQGSFYGWNYLGAGFIADPSRGQDLR